MRRKGSASLLDRVEHAAEDAAMPGGCLFCSIARGDVMASVVLADEVAIAFLDHRPVFKGHTLLMPRDHVETLAGLPGELLEPLFARAQLLARAIPRALGADGTFVAMNNVVSQSVPHLHVHVVPRRRKDGLRGFFWPRTRYDSDDEQREVAAAIAGAVAALR